MLRICRTISRAITTASRRLLKAAEQDNAIGQRIIGPVASQIKVPEKLETAVEQALGAALQNIVVRDDEYDAKALIEYLRSHSLGRATFLPLQALKLKYLSTKEERSFLKRKGRRRRGGRAHRSEAAGQKSGGFPAWRAPSWWRIWTRASELMRAAGYSFRAVTLQGDILAPGGVITGGGGKQKTYGLISRDTI